MKPGQLVAFPTPGISGVENTGLTKREYIASQVLAAIISNPTTFNVYKISDVADLARIYADELLAQLNIEENNK